MATTVKPRSEFEFSNLLRRRLEGWAARSAPLEACGLLLGLSSGGVTLRVRGVLRAENLAQRADRFELNPADWVRAERWGAALGLQVLGFWHSHPRGPAEPSGHDLRGTPAGYCCAIVGRSPLAGGSSKSELRLFERRGGRLVELELSGLP